MVPAYDGIDFPIAKTSLLRDNLRACIDTDTISNPASFILCSVWLFTFLVALPKMLNLHGTATILNDAMESKAVNALFGAGLAVSSSKGMTGHTLGAAAALELAFLLSVVDR